MEGNTEASFLSISCEVSSMKMITVAGAHACGKTSVILKTAELLLKENCRPGVMKLDCISSEDDRIYSAAGITNVKYISGNICPDHYFADSISDIFQWGLKEKLDLLIGNSPLDKAEGLDEEEKETIKANVLHILKENYGIEEEDFASAELEIVPAGKARDCGLDRSMILSYGQDDRVCAFTSLFAMLDVENAKRTGCCLLVDKEEIGSVGATGMHSRFFENTVAELVALTEGESDLKVRRALMNSRMLSSDVSAAYDPMYAEVFEKRSSAFFGKGLVFNKFTGARGKSGSNDANAEYLAKIRNAMDAQSVAYQFAELGKVDAGGGGTIAYIMANYGMEVIDSGVAVLSMHAPWEVTSKADVYEAYKGYKAFVEEMR